MKRSELKKKTVLELRTLAASRGHQGLSRLRKNELVTLLARPARGRAGRVSGKKTPVAKKKPAASRKPGAKATKRSATRRVGNRAARPVARKATKPAARKATKSVARKATKPAGKSVARKATKPAARKARKPSDASSSISPRLRRAFSGRPRNGEQRIKASKYYLGVAESTDLDEGYNYPETHGENAIALMVRDPYWLFAYWEFAPELRGELVAHIGEEALLRSRTVLRVYDVTGTEPESAAGHYDIDVAPEARNWYINVPRVEREYCVDVGLIAPDGSFIVIARSNRVSLPPVGPSDEVDEEWVTIDGLKEFYVRHEVHRGPSSGSGGWGSGGFGH